MMKMKRMTLLATAAFLSLGVAYAAESVQYPDGFRRWVHVRIGMNKEEMHHIFANPDAVKGYSSGNFPDGSILVFEVRAIHQTGDQIGEGDRRRVDVMIKDSSHYASTGGWRFERFMGADQLEDVIHDGGVSCFQCHAKVNDHGGVFSHLE